jgi:hypothetical protein
MYIRKSTRKNSSARSSQRGIRCVAGSGATASTGAGPSVCPGSGAGLAGNEGEISSGWAILWLRAALLAAHS